MNPLHWSSNFMLYIYYCTGKFGCHYNMVILNTSMRLVTWNIAQITNSHKIQRHACNCLYKDADTSMVFTVSILEKYYTHDDVIKWKHFPLHWPFVRGIHRSPVNSPHKGQWRGALIFSLICAWINGWVNNRKAGDLRRYRAHYGTIVMHSTDTTLSSLFH